MLLHAVSEKFNFLSFHPHNVHSSPTTMNSIGILVVLHILLLSAALASNPCPAGQYLDSSFSCVACSSCHLPNDIVIKRCNGRNDTVCGTSIDAHKIAPPSSRNKKLLSPSKNKNQKKFVSAEDEGAFLKGSSSSNLMPAETKNKSKENNDSVKMRKGKDKMKKNNPLVARLGTDGKIVMTKLPFDDNGKHIKKDLSTVDETISDSNQTSIRYAMESKPSDVFESKSSKKKKSKQKKNKNDEQSSEDIPWTPHIFPDILNHQISIDPEPTVSREVTPMEGDMKEKLAEALNVVMHRKKDKVKPIETDDDDYDDENILEEEDTDNDEDTIDDDDEDDEDEDEDGTNEDDNDDEEEDTASEDDIKDDDGNVSFDKSFSVTSKVKTKRKPFGVSRDTLPMSSNGAEDDDAEETIVHNKYEVNVEPFIDTSNWQLLILVSAVSACLLFFVVVNAYLCIYMKKWRHMKQDFEADVEDLSVRINLMQHAGFEADESNNMRNYITQLKGEKSFSEKVLKSTPHT